jgi:filamentous hemagglutinin family protein
MKKNIFKSFFISSFIFAGSAHAQIIPDNTLPINSSVIPGCVACEINGGTVRNGNLFHSFQEFSLPMGGEAIFKNTADIQNIFTRVTGSNASKIDGFISTSGSANLFLLNPNGIIFGQNAQLNIGGSFVASTADSIKFLDGASFGTKILESEPLLTVSVPMGLVLSNNPKAITVQGSGQGLLHQSSQFEPARRNPFTTGLRDFVREVNHPTPNTARLRQFTHHKNL